MPIDFSKFQKETEVKKAEKKINSQKELMFESKKPKETIKTTKLVIPEYIKKLFDNIDKSITSMWGIQKSGKIKWDSKFNQWETFKMWFMEMM